MDKFGKLRLINDDEVELMRQWRSAPAVRANMYNNHEISADEHHAWWSKIKHNEKYKYFMYEHLDIPSGIVAFTQIEHKNKNSFWAFYTSVNAIKGVGSKMEFLALDYAFNELGLHKLNCEVLSFNEAVIKLHHKFGFETEGVFKEQHQVNGEFYDIHRLALFSDSWKMNREKLFNIIESRSRSY